MMNGIENLSKIDGTITINYQSIKKYNYGPQTFC
jgi:hypothetical protein